MAEEAQVTQVGVYVANEQNEGAAVTQVAAYVANEQNEGAAVTQIAVYVAVTKWPFTGVATSQIGVYVAVDIARDLPRFNGLNVAIPYYEPGAYVLSDVAPGQLLEFADGSIRRHATASNLIRFDVQWRGLTAAEVAVLWSCYILQDHMLSWEPVQGGYYWVRIVPGTWRKASLINSGTIRYNVQLSFQGTKV